ncbi:prostacyclin receptor, partial [Cricetulus griseus]|uniref:prostacyclin receptor n=1 Tax=Cricetulus griseus TaxID=10029 RepID=UPI0015C3B24B
CDTFAFAMTFFGLASTLILFAMAVERCLALSHPYLYAQLDAPRCARLALPAIYAFCCLFCSLPLMGLGEHQQYCPGSWCFIRMRSTQPGGCAFSLAYASLVALLVTSIFFCNGSVTLSLCHMYRQQRRHHGSLVAPREVWGALEALGICGGWRRSPQLQRVGLAAGYPLPQPRSPSAPHIPSFTQAIAPDSSEMGDLLAFRFNAFNPILDPWVFILFRKAVFQRLKLWLCCLGARSVHGDLQTPLSRPASGRRDPLAPTALQAKEGNWVPLTSWGTGTGPQFTIFGTSTKTSLIHSTNSYGTLKSASLDSPGPPSKDARVLGDELTAMKGRWPIGSDASGSSLDSGPVFEVLIHTDPDCQPGQYLALGNLSTEKAEDRWKSPDR